MGISLSPEERQELFGTHGEAVLATTAPSGAPLPLPVWYVVLDGEIFVRTPSRAKRLRHIAKDPTVGFLVHDGVRWSELRGVLHTANAEFVSDAGTVAEVERALAERFAERLPPPLPGPVAERYDDSVVLRVVPLREPVSWDNRKIRV
ncbi:pyridoxamine 5'-phosphate oxidase family protein [Actinomadura livida]|uniref:Pyridoxamine 5'-phosphate oxidase N-terminal domain-containing protein n=1 Tax=Actinomadura livida TaxID=79909 RepID=A0A7W7ID02_9ACTN|nr:MULTISPECIES: pyridoxamine 5'-phosphate oxidase family protein [Actinomadura]MBB4774837.1 hypothetical protein [Actinomadura catellatispora]GGU05679.1 hypothetical protein GCM10010208_32350 [Actinomadura livida]